MRGIVPQHPALIRHLRVSAVSVQVSTMALVTQKGRIDVTSPSTPGFVERRSRKDMRAIFDEAYTHALPYLDPAQGIMGQPLTRQIGLMLHERYPHLSDADRLVFGAALQAAFKARSRHA